MTVKPKRSASVLLIIATLALLVATGTIPAIKADFAPPASPNLSADEVFQFALMQWQTHLVPQYESFEVPCAHTFLDYRCHSDDDVQFVTRMTDGKTSAYDLPQGGLAPERLMQGELIYGPGGAPLGFYRHIGNFAVIPTPGPDVDSTDTNPPEKTIADVSSIGKLYTTQLVGEEMIGGHMCYHLVMHSLHDPRHYPLHDLWVDKASYDIVALTYTWNFGEDQHPGFVHYRFAQIYPKNIWAIVHIDAQVITYRLFSRKAHIESIGDDLRNITFPADAPLDDFNPSPTPSPMAGT